MHPGVLAGDLDAVTEVLAGARRPSRIDALSAW
jgi:hypothetical protein